MKKSPIFGHVPGVPVGAVFPTRAALKAAGLHRDRMAGISYAAGIGADAIVISGGYEDDTDHGDEVIYTGHGGNSLETGRQIGDQVLHRGNLALARNWLEGLPVRVIRGARDAPPFGYRYDGLYYVTRYWRDIGRSGHTIWRFHLVRADLRGTSVPECTQWGVAEDQASYETGPRIEVAEQRIVRNSAMALAIKNLHDYRCQVCDTRLETLAGPYAEGAHIQPLAMPHNGPDTPDNLLCLCPNCHVRLDYGAMVIDPDLTVRDTATQAPLGHLRIHPRHPINPAFLAHHRSLFTAQQAEPRVEATNQG